MTILLKSGWQSVNIGDVAHTPGMLALLERHLPDAQVIWWPIVCNERVEQMIRRRFPAVEILPPELRTHREVPDETIRPVFERADVYLHGSGPNPMAMDQWRQWRRMTGKPIAVGGITVTNDNIATVDEMKAVDQFFCRDSLSLNFLQKAGLEKTRLGFGPDAAFATDVRDDPWADAFMAEHGLEQGRFACFIGRLRTPPFHKMDQWYKPDAETTRRGEELNARTAEPDHAKLRHVLTGWVRATGCNAVVCPEMIYQLDDADPLIYGPLPDDVKAKTVVQRDWWCTDQAVSLYSRAAAVVSMKMHSPVLAQRQGIPSLHIRQKEDTAKGQMWRDLGLEDWIFEIDETDGGDVLDTLLGIHAEPVAARDKVFAAQARIDAGHREMLQRIGILSGRA